jgi:hypothetical protein
MERGALPERTFSMAMSLLIVEGNLFQSRLTEKQRVTKRFCYGQSVGTSRDSWVSNA